MCYAKPRSLSVWSTTIALGLSVALVLSSCSASTASDAPPVAVSQSPTAVDAVQPSPTAPSSPDSSPTSDPRGQVLPITAQATIAGTLIQLEVARTSQEQSLGLMFRTELPDDRGMLFPFPSPQPARFWMRNVPIHLDMVFMNQGEVVAIADNVPPCMTPTCPTYGPNALVDQVIELRGGRAAELGLQAGDSITIEFLEAQP